MASRAEIIERVAKKLALNSDTLLASADTLLASDRTPEQVEWLWSRGVTEKFRQDWIASVTRTYDALAEYITELKTIA